MNVLSSIFFFPVTGFWLSRDADVCALTINTARVKNARVLVVLRIEGARSLLCVQVVDSKNRCRSRNCASLSAGLGNHQREWRFEHDRTPESTANENVAGNSRRRPRIQTLSPRIAVVQSSLPAVPVVKNGLKKIHGEQGAWETVKREA